MEPNELGSCRDYNRRVELIPILQSGEPGDASLTLPAIAREACAGMAVLYRNVGFVPPWIGYLARVDAVVAGTCAFKSPPRDDRVEIAYFTFPPFEGRGIASGMARELVKIAMTHAPGVLVVAQTAPERGPSTAILTRLNFHPIGPVEHPEDGTVWEWHLPTRPH